MNLRHRLTAVAGSAALLGLTLVSGLAQLEDEATVDIEILGGGPLSVSIAESPSGGFSDVSYNFDDQDSTGTLVVTVVDERGIASGWSVFVAADDFSGTSGIVGIENLDLVPGVIDHQRGNIDLSGQQTFPVAPMSSANTLLWSASEDFGDGDYDLPLAGTLTIPGGTLVGTYTSTLTVTINGATP